MLFQGVGAALELSGVAGLMIQSRDGHRGGQLSFLLAKDAVAYPSAPSHVACSRSQPSSLHALVLQSSSFMHLHCIHLACFTSTHAVQKGHARPAFWHLPVHCR